MVTRSGYPQVAANIGKPLVPHPWSTAFMAAQPPNILFIMADQMAAPLLPLAAVLAV